MVEQIDLAYSLGLNVLIITSFVAALKVGIAYRDDWERHAVCSCGGR
jgi:hypothetical protein